MLIIMGIKEQIIEELKNDNCTAKELSEKLEIGIDTIKSTITRMKKEDLILVIGYRHRHSIYSLNPDKFELNMENILKWLAFLDKMFKDNVDYLLENEEIVNLVMSNEEKFENITKVIEHFRKKSS